MSAKRIDLGSTARAVYRAIDALDQSVDFDPALRELVRLRASQINGCSYCIDMHARDALAAGESEQRIWTLSAWRTAPILRRARARGARPDRGDDQAAGGRRSRRCLCRGGEPLLGRGARQSDGCDHRHQRLEPRRCRDRARAGEGGRGSRRLNADLARHCDLLRSLHVPGAPLVLPNAWDVASAQAVVATGFPVVATTSGGVAAALGYDDHEGAPRDEMLAAAARISRSVDAPVTIDAEAGYGLDPAELVAALEAAGAAGCNLEDTNHSDGALRDPSEHASWLRSVREAAAAAGYGLVVNARVDVFLAGGPQGDLVPEALSRAHAYL